MANQQGRRREDPSSPHQTTTDTPCSFHCHWPHLWGFAESTSLKPLGLMERATTYAPGTPVNTPVPQFQEGSSFWQLAPRRKGGGPQQASLVRTPIASAAASMDTHSLHQHGHPQSSPRLTSPDIAV